MLMDNVWTARYTTYGVDSENIVEITNGQLDSFLERESDKCNRRRAASVWPVSINSAVSQTHTQLKATKLPLALSLETSKPSPQAYHSDSFVCRRPEATEFISCWRHYIPRRLSILRVVDVQLSSPYDTVIMWPQTLKRA